MCRTRASRPPSCPSLLEAPGVTRKQRKRRSGGVLRCAHFGTAHLQMHNLAPAYVYNESLEGFLPAPGVCKNLAPRTDTSFNQAMG